MFFKTHHSPFFGKGGYGDKLLGAAKGAARILDEPVVQSAVSVLAPELGMGLAAAKRSGLLEKLK